MKWLKATVYIKPAKNKFSGFISRGGLSVAQRRVVPNDEFTFKTANELTVILKKWKS